MTAAAVGAKELHEVLCGAVGPSLSAGVDLDMSQYTGTKHAYLDPATKLVLAAASGAMSDAGWRGDDVPAGLSVGSAYGCAASENSHARTLAAKGGRFVSPFVFSHSYHNSPNVVTSMDLDLKGFNTCVVCGVVSGGVAVGQAFDQIILGREKRMLAGGSDASGEKAQASCFLALQDTESAENERRRIVGRLLSWRCGSANYETLIEDVLAEAKVGRTDIGVTAGNVKTGLGDYLEFDALLGFSMGAAAVLDIASLCVFSEMGWPEGVPVCGNALVVRHDPAGLTCVLALRFVSKD